MIIYVNVIQKKKQRGSLDFQRMQKLKKVRFTHLLILELLLKILHEYSNFFWWWRWDWIPHSLLPLKGASVLGRAERLQLEGVMQHSSGSGNFPEHSRGHSPLWLSVCPGTNPQNTGHLKLQWHRRPLLAFSSSIFPPGGLGRVWDPQGEMDHILLVSFNLQHPGTKTTLALFDFWKLCDWILFSNFKIPPRGGLSFLNQMKFCNAACSGA